MTDMPIVWLDKVLDYAIRQNVSDVHIELIEAQGPAHLNIRVRAAGDLTEWPGLAGAQARAVASRIKSIANVGSGAVRRAEEGRYVHRLNASNIDRDTPQAQYEEMITHLERVDLRLVVLPTILGEKLVLRLPSISNIPTVPELGFTPQNLELVNGILGQANGLTLFAGPVGAGKTTSMYSALMQLGGPNKAVYSVEDPVERALPHVDQIEVNEAAGNTFASILRSMRRSDLQVLMIGEIRDQETALSAIQISIAGSRVVSSIHANDSIAAVEAMLALSGANPYQVTQSLRGVVSQRLVKRSHPACAGQGCDGCGGSGAAGRVAIHEVLPITPEFADGVTRGATRQELEVLAKEAGMVHLEVDAAARITAGHTRQEWVMEVLGA